jgi:hypothetical protein
MVDKSSPNEERVLHKCVVSIVFELERDAVVSIGYYITNFMIYTAYPAPFG